MIKGKLKVGDKLKSIDAEKEFVSEVLQVEDKAVLIKTEYGDVWYGYGLVNMVFERVKE